MNDKRTISLLMALTLAATLVGCGGQAQRPRGPVISTVAYRFHYELVGDAQRVRIDTQPTWQGGRYAYREGSDQLLVISRITAWADNVSDEQRESGQFTRTDRIVERLWLTLPPDMEVGKWIDLYEMNLDLRVGYDEKPPAADEFFIRAFGVQGKIMLWEQNGQEKTFRMSLRVAPKDRTDWNVHETITLSAMPDGVLATRAPLDAPFSAPRVRMTAEEQLRAELTGQPVPEAAAIAPTTQPVNEQQARTQAAPPDPAKILGQWQGDTGVYELRLQFKDNGKFVYSTSRSGFSPGMKYGKWFIRGDYLVMEVSRFEFDGRDHMKFLAKDPFIILRIRVLDDTQLSLFGDYKDREGGRNMQVDFFRGNFPDMEVTVPPNRP